MLGTLVKKEILTNLFSFRFMAAFVLLLIVIPVTVFILTSDGVKRIDDDSLRRAEIETYLKSFAHFNRLQNIIAPAQPPLPFFSLVRGISSDVNLENFDNDPLPVMFPLIDLVFIVSILLSLMALLFSYDSVCGEKEDGTLKLMLANGISRSQVILGKILGGITTLLVPFLVSLALGLIIILLNPRIGWRGADWGALGWILAGSVLCYTVFYGLGVFVSARHQASPSSVMTSLFIWVLAVLIIPNLSPYLASFLSPAPSQIKIGRQIDRLTDVERDELGRKLQQERTAELFKKYPILAETRSLSKAQITELVQRDPAFREAYQALTQEIQRAWDDANRIQNEKANDLRREVERKTEAQTRLAKSISIVSPLADFTYLATDLSSTGIRNQSHFSRIAGIWWQSYGEYSRGKIEALQKKDPSLDWWNTAVDVSDMPRFSYREEDLSGRIRGSLPFFAILMVMIVVVFGAAYISFIGYDVR